MKKIYSLFVLSVFASFHLYAQGGFVKVVDALNPVTTFTSAGAYKGAAWVDFDNDNDVDLFASPNFLFRNDGSGTFVQLSNLFAFTPAQNMGGSSWADLNNDGFIDCIIAQYPSGVYTNNGNGTFTNISSQIPNLNGFPSWGCAIGNWNNDAWVDYTFVHAAGFHPSGPFPSKLYLSTDSLLVPQYITGYTLTDSTKPYTVPYWSDYDLDGDQDLFVASGPAGSPGPDFCYKSLAIETGLDTLQRMTTELFASQLQDGQCYNFIDYDNDGDMDLCLTNYAGAQTRFYVNTAGTWTLQSTPFTTTVRNLSSDWGDYDSDGDIDVIITSDQVAIKYYKNNGNGTFASAINIGTTGASGITNGDYDNDGDLDLFIHGTASARALYRNDSAAAGNHWVNIKCTGTASNKSALGAILKIKATINGNPVWQLREINAQNAFQSQNDLRLHFGLGNATTADSLIIKYPSGNTETFTNVAADNFYCNEEASGSLCMVTALSEESFHAAQLNIYPNPVQHELTVETKQFQNEKELAVTIFDLCGKTIEQKSFVLSGSSLKIPVRTLPAGAYIIEVKGRSEQLKARFIKGN
jgi:enediyne biosynthesis protein E4